MSTQEIQVFLQPATSRGRLYPHFDREANIFSLSSKETRSWPYGADIDGNLIFDFDNEKVLANLDLLVGPKFWKQRIFKAWPSKIKKADLGFQEKTLKIKSFHIPLQIWTNKGTTEILISFSNDKTPATFVDLSENCLALLKENILLGFWVKTSKAIK